MTPKEFRKTYGVKVKARFDGEWEQTPEGDDWPHTRYRVTMKNARGDKVKFDFRMGLAHTDFDKDSALYGFGSDVASYETHDTFESFADDYGYDPDSRKHYAIWEACRDARNKAYEWCLSEEMFERLWQLQY